MNINELLTNKPVVPLVQADDPAIAVATSRALAAGGLQVAEVVFRTDRALECLQAVADDVPEMIAGAGTVLSAEQARAAIDNGARFIVSPGLDDGVVAVAKDHGVPVYPGTMTPSEVQHAFNLGLAGYKLSTHQMADVLVGRMGVHQTTVLHRGLLGRPVCRRNERRAEMQRPRRLHRGHLFDDE